MSYSFNDKVVLITGGNSGIGLACVKKFHELGARIIATGRKQLHQVTHLSALELDLLQKIDYQVCDVASSDAINHLFSYVNQHYGILDCAINNAGTVGNTSAPITDLTIADYDEVMNINVRGVFLCMQQELRMMLKQQAGSIINISSVAGLIGSMVGPLYGTSKFAVNGLTRSAALAYVKQGIRINALCPGLVETPLITNGLSSDTIQHIEASIPMGRAAQPEEIANVAVWLSSAEASFITGATMPVDGGTMA